jgi:phosphate transport system substrate-binding protein
MKNKNKEKCMFKKLSVLMIVVVAGSLFLSACQTATPVITQAAAAAAAPAAEPTLAPGSVQLVAQGATFPLPVYDVWTKSYQFVDPAVNITYAGTGSGAGKKAIVDGTVDFAGSDSVLKDEYKTVADLQMLPTLAGAVVPIFNLISSEKDKDGKAIAITALVLDRQILADIYQAKIVKWNDAAIAKLNPTAKLPDAGITVIHRSDSSGTTEIFTNALASFSADWKDNVGAGSTVEWPVDKNGNGLGAKGNPGVAVAVANTTNSIGYVELSYAVANKLAFAQLVNKSGKTVKADAASIQADMGDFANSFDDKLTAKIVDGSSAGSWPITGYTYLIVRLQSMKDCVKAAKAVEYIKWTLTDARATKIANDLGYASLPKSVLDLVMAKLNSLTCNGAVVAK